MRWVVLAVLVSGCGQSTVERWCEVTAPCLGGTVEQCLALNDGEPPLCEPYLEAWIDCVEAEGCEVDCNRRAIDSTAAECD